MTATTGRENRFQPSGRPGAAPAPAPAAAPAPPAKAKSNKKTIIIVVVAMLVLGGVGYKFLAPKPPYVPAAGEVVALDVQTLNLTGGHYAKVGVSVQLLKGKATAAAFDSAEASQLVIEEYANRAVEDMDTNAKRAALQKDLLTQIKKAYPGKIWAVYVTQFVTQ
jgi:flagellar basal body-associated protein FliL